MPHFRQILDKHIAEYSTVCAVYQTHCHRLGLFSHALSSIVNAADVSSACTSKAIEVLRYVIFKCGHLQIDSRVQAEQSPNYTELKMSLHKVFFVVKGCLENRSHTWGGETLYGVTYSTVKATQLTL